MVAKNNDKKARALEDKSAQRRAEIEARTKEQALKIKEEERLAKEVAKKVAEEKKRQLEEAKIKAEEARVKAEKEAEAQKILAQRQAMYEDRAPEREANRLLKIKEAQEAAEVEELRLKEERLKAKIKAGKEAEAEKIRLEKEAAKTKILKMFRNHTVFKTVDGAFYAVSQRAIDMGYKPNKDVVIATDDERTNFFVGVKEKASQTPSKEQKKILSKNFKKENVLTKSMATLLGVPYPKEGELSG